MTHETREIRRITHDNVQILQHIWNKVKERHEAFEQWKGLHNSVRKT
jgi:hypothetical protein